MPCVLYAKWKVFLHSERAQSNRHPRSCSIQYTLQDLVRRSIRVDFQDPAPRGTPTEVSIRDHKCRSFAEAQNRM